MIDHAYHARYLHPKEYIPWKSRSELCIAAQQTRLISLRHRLSAYYQQYQFFILSRVSGYQIDPQYPDSGSKYIRAYLYFLERWNSTFWLQPNFYSEFFFKATSFDNNLESFEICFSCFTITLNCMSYLNHQKLSLNLYQTCYAHFCR